MACVPVGVSAHTTEAGHARPHTAPRRRRARPRRAVAGPAARRRIGRRLVYAADEYYLLAGRPFPDADATTGSPSTRTASAWRGPSTPPSGVTTTPPSGSGRDSSPGSTGRRRPGTGPRSPRAPGPPGRGRPHRRGAPSADRWPSSPASTGPWCSGRCCRSDGGVGPDRHRRPRSGCSRCATPSSAATSPSPGSSPAPTSVRALAGEPVGHRYLLPDVCLSEGRFLDGTTVDELPRRVEIVPSRRALAAPGPRGPHPGGEHGPCSEGVDGRRFHRVDGRGAASGSMSTVAVSTRTGSSGRGGPGSRAGILGPASLGPALGGGGGTPQRGQVHVGEPLRGATGGGGTRRGPGSPATAWSSTPSGTGAPSWSWTPAGGWAGATTSTPRWPSRRSGPWPPPTSCCWWSTSRSGSPPRTRTWPASWCAAGARCCWWSTRSTTTAARSTPGSSCPSGSGDPWTVSALHGRGTGDLLDEIVRRLPGPRRAIPGSRDASPTDGPADDVGPEPFPETDRRRAPGRGRARMPTGGPGGPAERGQVDALQPAARRGALGGPRPARAPRATPSTPCSRPPTGPCASSTPPGCGASRVPRRAPSTSPWCGPSQRSTAPTSSCSCIDATEGVTHQDQRLAERIGASGSPVVVVLNKWELLGHRAATRRPRRRRGPAGLPGGLAGSQGERAHRSRCPPDPPRVCARRWRRTTGASRPVSSTGRCGPSRPPTPPPDRGSATPCRERSTPRPSRSSPPAGCRHLPALRRAQAPRGLRHRSDPRQDPGATAS